MATKNKLKLLYNLSTDFIGPPSPLSKVTLKILLASMMHTWTRNIFLRCHLIFKKLKVSKILVFHSYSKVIQANTFCILFCFLCPLLKMSHQPHLIIGVLEKERARRLIHNYNLIYNLSLSPRKIDQALRRFRSGENMLLEPALQYLKEL